MKLNFVIYGLGAIGGFYGTKLAQYKKEAGFGLTFVARGDTYKRLQAEGSELDCEDGLIKNQDFQLCSSFLAVELDPDAYTVVLLCVKSKDTISACEDIQKNLSAKTVVISIQNGIENEERIASILGVEKTIAALTNIAAEVIEPGVYQQKGRYVFVMGELDENRNQQWNGRVRLAILAEIFNAAGIKTKIRDDIMLALWSKLVWNAAFNPMSVAYDNLVGELLSDEEKREQLIGIMYEVKALAELEGYKLDDDVVEQHLERTSGPDWANFRTSMYQDFQKGKEIELDDLLGVVIRRAAKHDLQVPYAQKLMNTF